MNEKLAEIARLIESIPEETMRQDHNKLLLLRTLKTFWCYKKVYDIPTLELFLESVDDELLELRRAHRVQHRIVEDHWRFTNASVSTVPVLFTWLCVNAPDYDAPDAPSVELIIDTLGRYCVESTSAALHVLTHDVLQLLTAEPSQFYGNLHATLAKAEILHTPPLRDDICYRFTKRFTKIVQQIRDTV